MGMAARNRAKAVMKTIMVKRECYNDGWRRPLNSALKKPPFSWVISEEQQMEGRKQTMVQIRKAADLVGQQNEMVIAVFCTCPWLLNTRTHSNLDYLQKYKTGSIQAWMGEGLIRPHPCWRAILVVNGCWWRKSQFSLAFIVLIRLQMAPHPSTFR